MLVKNRGSLAKTGTPASCTLGKFKVWGWGSSVKRAKVLAVNEIVNRARHQGVLAQACSLNLGHPELLLESSAERFEV